MAYNKKNKASSLIRPGFVFSTYSKAKTIGIGRPDGNRPEKYIPKTQANLRAIMKLSGKPDVYDGNKKNGKLFLWW